MTIAEAALALLAELEAHDIPAPLTARFTLATTLADLARIAGEALPTEIARALDRPVCLPVEVCGHPQNHRPAFLAD